MAAINLVVMGKTGAGKSTLINAVLGEELAPTGTGGAVTKEVHTYSKMMSFHLPVSETDGTSGEYGMICQTVNLYDTVGLEIDSSITKKTLKDVRKILHSTKEGGDEQDITLVWFCMSAASRRFEKYEAKLIQNLSIEYEIPFVIVLTQCFSDERGGLEQQIEKDLPEISMIRVLAKDYQTRGGTIPAFGVDDLLCHSITEYSEKRVHILRAKLDKLLNSRTEKLQRKERKGTAIIEKHSEKASKIGIIPVLSIPFVHGLCHQMICELNKLYGVNASAGERIENAIAGFLVTPLMMVPFLSSLAASAYIESIGEAYLKALSAVANESLSDIDISRVYDELQKQQKEVEE